MNRFDTEKQKRNAGPLGAVALLCCAVAAMVAGVSALNRAAYGNEAATLAQTVARGAVHCYALEGSYPESLAYLEEHYGLVYDDSRYLIDYRCFAQNLMPEITVVPLGGEGE